MTIDAARQHIRILDPVGLIEPEEVPTVPLPLVAPPRRQPVRRLQGATLGVLTNVFRGYDVPGAVAERLAQQFGMEVVRFEKPLISRTAKPEIIGELAEKADVVIVGLAA